MYETDDQKAARYFLMLVAQQATRIAELEDALADAELMTDGAALGAIHGMREKAREQRQRDQEKIKNLEKDNGNFRQIILAQNKEIEAMKSALSKRAPIALLPLSNEALDAIQAKAEREGKKILKTTYGEICEVNIIVSIRSEWDNPVPDDTRYFHYFPGSPDDAKREILPRVNALISRAPMLDNLHRRGIPPSVSDETLLNGLSQVADWWHVTDIRQSDQVNYHQRLKDTFVQFIKPEVNLGEIAETEAYNRWRKAVEDSFVNMAKSGRGRGDKPTARTPRKRSKYKRDTLRRISS